MIVSLLVLIPGQSPFLLAIAIIVNTSGVLVGLKSLRTTQASHLTVATNIVLTIFAVVPYLVAGSLLLVGNMDALFWISPGMIMSTVKAVSDAWVLLVEINR